MGTGSNCGVKLAQPVISETLAQVHRIALDNTIHHLFYFNEFSSHRLFGSLQLHGGRVDPVGLQVLGLRGPAQQRLIARREASGPGAVYRFDLHVQGERETVFFDI